MMTSVTPKVRSRARVISSSVRPESSTRALGRVSVRGRRRVPRPAARIMAFIRGDSRWEKEMAPARLRRRVLQKRREICAWCSLEGFPFAEFFEFKMAEDHFEAVAVAEALGELLGEKNGAVLAASAAERDH